MFYCILKFQLLLISYNLFIKVDAVFCPPYCRCSISGSLKHVKCVHQNLVTVDLDVPRSVQWLELSYNAIYELKDFTFQNLGLVEILKLHLNHNAIHSIGLNAFHGLQFIQEIDLSRNHLYRIDAATFEYNPLLSHLILNGNPLRNVPAHRPFLISQSLKVLELSHCRLSYLPAEAFQSLPNLQYLNISNNDILIINEALMNTWKELKELDITNTAIKCDRSNSSLMTWADRKSVRLFGSPCVPFPFDGNKMKGSSKLEKIIMLEKPTKYNSDMTDYSSEKNDDYDEIDCSCSDKDEQLLATTTTSVPTNFIKTKKIPWNDYQYVVCLSFITGLVVGIAMSSSVICCGIFCCKYRHINRNGRNNWQRSCSIQYDSVSRASAPPAYSDLF